MLSSAIFSLGIPPTFTLTGSETNYYLERDAYERCYNRYLLANEGFSYTQEEGDDWSEWDADLATYESAFSTWLDNAVAAQEGGLPVPAPPSLPAPPTSVPWWVTAIKIAITVIKLVLLWDKKRKEAGSDTSELVHLIRQAMMLKDPSDPSKYIPILELLANTPLSIFINRSGEFQDAMYTMQPPE